MDTITGGLNQTVFTRSKTQEQSHFEVGQLSYDVLEAQVIHLDTPLIIGSFKWDETGVMLDGGGYADNGDGWLVPECLILGALITPHLD